MSNPFRNVRGAGSIETATLTGCMVHDNGKSAKHLLLRRTQQSLAITAKEG